MSAFLKVRHGKGAKFRRVPVSNRLRREVVRYPPSIPSTARAGPRGDWQAVEIGGGLDGEFVSDPPGATVNVRSVIGRRRNGVFFSDD